MSAAFTPTVAQLLEDAPDGQAARMRGVYQSIAQGKWSDAAFGLQNAATETFETSRDFALAACKLCIYCECRAAETAATTKDAEVGQ